MDTRLVDSAARLVVQDHGMSTQLAHMLKPAGQAAQDVKPVLEVNAEHPLVKKLDGSVHFNDLAHRLKQRGADLVYRCGKGHSNDSEPRQSDKYSGELELTPLELIDRIAQLVPPPRTHHHRYYGVLAPNSLCRAAVTAMAPLPDAHHCLYHFQGRHPKDSGAHRHRPRSPAHRPGTRSTTVG